MSRTSDIVLAGIVAGLVVACSDIATETMGDMAVDAGGLLRQMGSAMESAGDDLVDAGDTVRDTAGAMVKDAAAQGSEGATAPEPIYMESACDIVVKTTNTTYPDAGDDRFTRTEQHYAEFDIGDLGPGTIRGLTVVLCGYAPQPAKASTCPEGAICAPETDATLSCAAQGGAQVEAGKVRVACGTVFQQRGVIGGAAGGFDYTWSTVRLTVIPNE